MAVELNESARKSALQSLYCVMKEEEWIVLDGKQVVQWPSVPHSFKHFQCLSNDGFNLADKFIKPVGITGTEASPPEDHSVVDRACVHRLIKDLQHLGSYIKRFELPQKIQSAHLCPPVQSAVQTDTQVLTVFSTFNLLTHDVYFNPVALAANAVTFTSTLLPLQQTLSPSH